MFRTGLYNLMAKALDGSVKNHAVISNNIANVNTPGYKRKDVPFKQVLKESLEQDRLRLKITRGRHLREASAKADPGRIIVLETENTRLRNDGNNVDIDMEMSALAENTIYFESLSRLLSSQISLLKTAISEGRR